MRPNLVLITNPQKPREEKKKKNLEPAKDILKDWFKMTEKKYESALTMAGTRSFHLGYKIRDSLKPGDVSFLFSAPKMGATAILLKIIEEYNEAEFPILYVNSEMERTEFITRLLASHTGLPLAYLRRATLYEDDWAKLTMCGASILEDFIYFSTDYQVDQLSLQRGMGLYLNEKKRKRIVCF